MIFEVRNVQTRVIESSAAEAKVVKAIKDYLTYTVDNYYHSAAYKQRRWDGKKSLLKYSRFPTGFLPHVLKKLPELWQKALKREFEPAELLIEDKRQNLPEFTEYTFTVLGNELRDYQQEAVRQCDRHIDTPDGSSLYFPRGIINAAVNAGKTYIVAALIDSIQDCSCLFIVHQKALYQQHRDFMVEVFGRADVGEIRSGLVQPGKVTVATIQTLKNAIEKDPDIEHYAQQQVNTLFVDEAHRAGAKSYSETLSVINAGCRLAFSGTALKNDNKEKNLKVIASFGPVIKEVSNKQLVDKGVSRKPVVHLHFIKTNIGVADPELIKYRAAQTLFIEESKERLNKILKIVGSRQDKYIFISFIKIKHGLTIKESIEKEFPNLSVQYADGNTTNRKQLISNFNKGQFEVFVCSMIAKEGINLPNIDVMIVAQGGKSAITTAQIIGRGQRKKEGHDTVEVHDFWDDGAYVSKHSHKRIKQYAAEEFEILPQYPATKTYQPKRAFLAQIHEQS